MIPTHRIKLPNSNELHISSLWRAADIHHDYEWVVSLLDPGMYPGFHHMGGHHIFHVDDTENPTRHDTLLTERDIRFLTSLKVSPGHKALVHCHAGISRSTAIGSMIAFANGASLDDIRSGLDWDIANPNMLILDWSKAVLGTDLVVPISQWWLSHRPEVDNGPYSR